VSKRLTAQVGDDKSCSGSLAVFEAMFDQAAASILPLGRPN
jgi:hypothetical protein